jgi:hypothetical protein
LIQNPAKTFLSGRNLTLWDSLYKDMTGMKGLLSYCIHKVINEEGKLLFCADSINLWILADKMLMPNLQNYA